MSSYALLNSPPKLDEMTKRNRNIRSICWEEAKRRFPNNKVKRYKFFDLFYEMALAYSRVIHERILSKELRIPLINMGSLRPRKEGFNRVTTVWNFDSKGLVPLPVEIRRMKLARNEIIVIKNDGSPEALNAIAEVVHKHRKYSVKTFRTVVQIDNDYFLNVRIPVGTFFVSPFPGMYMGLTSFELFEHFRYIQKDEEVEVINEGKLNSEDDLPDNLELIDEALEKADWFKAESTRETNRIHEPLNPLFKQVDSRTYDEVLMNPAYPTPDERDEMFKQMGYKKTMEILYLMKKGYNVDIQTPGLDEEAITDYIVKAGYTQEEMEETFVEIEQELEKDDVDLDNFNFEA